MENGMTPTFGSPPHIITLDCENKADWALVTFVVVDRGEKAKRV